MLKQLTQRKELLAIKENMDKLKTFIMKNSFTKVISALAVLILIMFIVKIYNQLDNPIWIVAMVLGVSTLIISIHPGLSKKILVPIRKQCKKPVAKINKKISAFNKMVISNPATSVLVLVSLFLLLYSIYLKVFAKPWYAKLWPF